eukprot:CAMPEP_0114435930 /NCGR_PEP_ID=MMETSP0103-20121206/13137_1 /TAXON_ID=37642 ORGANISM="Paraphysomonas imperforata, Strain PA2" /NCGR_SAMPLE_ID=MMETSP0103 /ASSEMBLY_ACC=CAM_ASM_000201 /LENGTH=63 /DNA_ID=CAMNT_0001606077 /DNA_START=703 /DNA_END=891 /DNA_ORIENTATION=-
MVSTLMDESYSEDAAEGLSQELSIYIVKLKESIRSVREAGEESDLWSNKDVQSLLTHMQSAEY